MLRLSGMVGLSLSGGRLGAGPLDAPHMIGHGTQCCWGNQAFPGAGSRFPPPWQPAAPCGAGEGLGR